MEKQYKLELLEHLLKDEIPVEKRESVIQYLSSDELFDEILFLELLRKMIDTEIRWLKSEWLSE
jgi:hypothetical protein